MKLAVTLSLVMLAFCCSSASAKDLPICPGFQKVIETLLMGTVPSYQKALQPFNPAQELQDSGVQMKMVLDTLSQETRENILKLTERILTSPQCKKDLKI
uniref:Uteroglobin n=1 Tax=Jaculus jaculus TaxID=51337 RepID=A0A8C5KIT1_JACJA|nr:uteroglobin [Jaculus jaculus]